jgi:cytochrome c oxidase subunit II
MRNALMIGLLACAALAVVDSTATARRDPTPETVIKLTAKKFEFSPAEITVKKGEPVLLEIRSEDVKHGFSLPDFRVRTEIKPGSVTQLRFTPDKTGRFGFTCDVFCGAGHEDMSGTLIVNE